MGESALTCFKSTVSSLLCAPLHKSEGFFLPSFYLLRCKMKAYTSQLSGQSKGLICALCPTCWLRSSLTRASFLGWFQARSRPEQQAAVMGWWDPLPNDSVIVLDELMTLPFLFTINVNFICQRVYFPGNGWLLPYTLQSWKLTDHQRPLEFWVWQTEELARYLTVGSEPQWCSISLTNKTSHHCYWGFQFII